MSRTVAWILVAAIACGRSARTPLYKAGDERDDGAGLLARASTQLETGDDTEPGFGATRSARRVYGGDLYGGDAYGGTGYANWTAPQWTFQQPNRAPRYAVVATGLDAAIEGLVTWSGPVPVKVTTPCGAIDNPSLRLAPSRGVRGAIVYIERITTGRAAPYLGRPASVGGILVKHGCTFGPAVQIVEPLPAAIAIHGDGHRTRVRVTPTGAAPKLVDLQEGGLVQVEVKAGITKVDSDDGSSVAAWIVALDTPYFAVTDDSGRFRIDELAPGTYDVTFWQPPIASTGVDGSVAYGAPIVVHRAVHVDAGHITHVIVAMPGR